MILHPQIPHLFVILTHLLNECSDFIAEHPHSVALDFCVGEIVEQLLRPTPSAVLLSPVRIPLIGLLIESSVTHLDIALMFQPSLVRFFHTDLIDRAKAPFQSLHPPLQFWIDRHCHDRVRFSNFRHFCRLSPYP